MINTYPIAVSKNLAISAKEDKLSLRANLIATSISNAGFISIDDISTAVTKNPLEKNERVIVCNTNGTSLFDSSIFGNTLGKNLMLTEIITALSGETAFECELSNTTFESRVAVPVKHNDNIIGAVYFYEKDDEQASLLSGMQRRLAWFSLVLALVLILVVFISSWKLSMRLSALLNGIRGMRDGEYTSTVEVKGHDELAEIFEEFNAMSERLRETELLRRRFVSDASHELRTPLSSIKLLTDSIVQTPDIDIDTAREFLKDIGEEIDRLSRITDKLLVLTRLDGNNQLEHKKVNVSKTVNLVIDSLLPLAEENSVTLRRDLTEDINIMADSDAVHQIIFNLVENAIKYNKPEGYVHTILFEREGKCTLIVDDNGIGIPEEHYEEIFQRFYRVDKARSRTGKGGSGLGLSIVKRNVESYNGTISVQPSATGGTRFTVEFPVYKEEVRDEN